MRFRDHFAAMIEAGSLAPGTKLPPERALAEQFSVTRVTVRQALTILEGEGLPAGDRDSRVRSGAMPLWWFLHRGSGVPC